MGIEECGGPADFVICPSARKASVLLARPQVDRIVVRNGSVFQSPLPCFSELDHLVMDTSFYCLIGWCRSAQDLSAFHPTQLEADAAIADTVRRRWKIVLPTISGARIIMEGKQNAVKELSAMFRLDSDEEDVGRRRRR